MNPRLVRIRNGNEVPVIVQPFFAEGTLPAAGEQISLPPGASREVRLPLEFERVGARLGHAALVPSMLIVDSAGRAWVRSGDGGLERLAPTSRAALERGLAATPTRLPFGDE